MFFSGGSSLGLYPLHSQLMDEETEAENKMLIYLLRLAIARSQPWNSSHSSVSVHLHWLSRKTIHLFILLLNHSVNIFIDMVLEGV